MSKRTAKRKRQLRKAIERLHKLIRTPRKPRPRKMVVASEVSERRYLEMREALRRTGNYEPLRCRMLIHRAMLTVDYRPPSEFQWDWLGHIPGIGLARLQRLWRQQYSFARRITGLGILHDSTVEYSPTNGYAPPIRLNLIPRSSTGFTWRDFQAIAGALPNYEIVTMEVAWNFPIESEVDVQIR
jgi:hypothetical protein